MEDIPELTLPSPPLKTEPLIFGQFPAFARFVKEHHIREYVHEQIRLSVELNLPLMQKLAHIPEDQLLELGITGHIEHLEHVENNTLRQRLDDSLKMWEEDNLQIVAQDDIAVEDITVGAHIRKMALMKFLPLYTTDPYTMLEIIKEIDIYEQVAMTEASNLYIKLLKKKINEHAHLIERVTNTSPAAIYVYDYQQNKEIYSNGKLLNLLGYTGDDFTTMSDVMTQIAHPDDIERLKQNDDEILRISDGEIKTLDFRCHHKNGTYRWIRSFRSVFKRDHTGKPSQIIGISTDITEEKKKEQQLKHSESLLLEAQESALMGSYIVNVGTGEIEVTPQFKKIFELEDTSRDIILANVHPADRLKLEEARNKAIEEMGSYDFEYRYYVNNREKIIWVHGVVSFVDGEKVIKGTVMDVTERKHMIQRLQRSEELYKQAEAKTHIGNWVWYLANQKFEWSDELYRIHELEPGSELTYDLIASFNQPEDAEKVKAIMTRAIETKEPYDFHYRITTRSGKNKILHAMGEVMTNYEGQPFKLRGTLQDVTERQNMIERLQLSEFLYKQAQSISHVGNWEWNVHEQTLTWSDELYRIFGMQPQSKVIDFNGYTSLIHEQDRAATVNSILDSLQSREPFENYYRIINADGKEKIIHSLGEVETDQAGNPVKMYGICQDVTKEKITEKALQENEAFIQKIANTTPSLIASYNVHTGKYSYINSAVEKILGYSRQVIFEKGVDFFVDIVHPDDIGPLMEKNAKALEEANSTPPGEGKEFIVEFKYRMRNSTGEYRWFHTYGTIFDRNAEGKVENLLNVSVDITEQEEAEQALYQNNLLLKQSNSSLEEYAYVASHDLKEPLRKISTFGDKLLTLEYDNLSDDSKVYLEKIISSARRMQQMINDLLSISIITGNRQFETVSLQKILEETLQTLEHKIETSEAVVNVEALPALNVVPSQFRQLFQNLLSNSLKFVKPDTSPIIDITWKYLHPREVSSYRLAKAGRYLQLDFTDNGIGLDNTFANKIFIIFQRLHGKTEYEGTGIGLAICKKIAENHGGTIFANGQPGKGTTFTVIIPA